MNLTDEIFDHFFGHLKVGDHAVPHGANGFHVAGRTAQHLLGLYAHGVNHLAPADIAQGHDRRFVKHYAPALHVDERIGRSQIHRNVVREPAEEAF